MEALLDRLFESTAKARMLKLFLMNPEREFAMPEIVKQTQLKKPAVKKELAKLLKLGLVKTRIIKNTKENKRKQKLTKVARANKKKTQIVKETKTAKTIKAKRVAQAKKKRKTKKR